MVHKFVQLAFAWIAERSDVFGWLCNMRSYWSSVLLCIRNLDNEDVH